MTERWENAAVSVPCGKCPICLKKRAMDWCFRLEHENRVSKSSCFITLTYEQPPLTENGIPTLCRSDLTNFIKRLRKSTHEKLKYYAVGEYGTKNRRPHYHIILFNYPMRKLLRASSILDIWKGGTWYHAIPGHIQIDACNSASIGYVANYCQVGTFRPDHRYYDGLIDDRVPHYSVMSKKMGLSYLSSNVYRYHVRTLSAFVTRPGGSIQRLPKYFRDKIFTKSEKMEIQKQVDEWAKFDPLDLYRSAEHRVSHKKMIIQLHERNLKSTR